MKALFLLTVHRHHLFLATRSRIEHDPRVAWRREAPLVSDLPPHARCVAAGVGGVTGPRHLGSTGGGRHRGNGGAGRVRPVFGPPAPVVGQFFLH